MPRRLGAAEGDIDGCYDNPFLITSAPSDAPRHHASLKSERNGLELEIRSTEYAVQLFEAGTIAIPVAGLHGRPYGRFCGLCLEPERLPSAIENAAMPSPILRPGETYRQQTEYRFSWT
jgi:aldose 1-epimerase